MLSCPVGARRTLNRETVDKQMKLQKSTNNVHAFVTNYIVPDCRDQPLSFYTISLYYTCNA